MNAKTIAELDLRRAQLAAQAAKTRQEWRTLPTGTRSSILGKRVKELEQQAADYAAILALVTAPVATTTELRKAG
ncbi:hypothetical protein [Streptomyces sp. S1D4-14]|uniref:hypothetical protein n=1 Tax=Streptomyces sp. S1D4-14 TaxID=2594461 RepID=UPI001162BEC7|nr:hypothetical protein [Streptomyces sp. S1D4-14]QDN64405.1 hypothetical protein FNV66_00810 [Streptomyces sp. S1D4-14]